MNAEQVQNSMCEELRKEITANKGTLVKKGDTYEVSVMGYTTTIVSDTLDKFMSGAINDIEHMGHMTIVSMYIAALDAVYREQEWVTI